MVSLKAKVIILINNIESAPKEFCENRKMFCEFKRFQGYTGKTFDESGKIIDGVRDSLYKITDNGDRTFVNEEELPSLPVPPLSKTLNTYLESVRAVVTDDEYAKTVEIVKNFENSPNAKILQDKLMQRSEQNKNWLEQWWEEIAYLKQRLQLIPYWNMSGIMPPMDYWPIKKGSRSERFALIMNAHMQFWNILRKEQLKRTNPKGGCEPWSMHQFKRIYNTCRVPGEDKDTLMTLFKTEYEGPSAPTNVIVLYRGYIFTFDLLFENEILTPPEIESQLKYIENWCNEQTVSGPGIGALTTNNRTVWAKNRDYLMTLNPENKKYINTIESALMVYSFSDNEPVTSQEILTDTMFGGCEDRWADKFTAIGYLNGTMSGNADHTPFDGFVIAQVLHYILLTLNDCNGVYNGPIVERDLKVPEHLQFHTDPKIIEEIETAKMAYRSACDDIDVIYRTFSDYGRSLSAKHKIHPEAYIQLALQLTYYRTHERPAPTYCTASTRTFYHGRTETCRSCVPESVAFAKAVMNGNISNDELYMMMQKACQKFQNLTREASNGFGCDRHLLGIYLTALENDIEIPEIFQDQSWIKSGGNGNFLLSTSCIGYWNICGSVPAMRDDGYSCFYGIENHQYSFTLSSFKRCSETSTELFYDNLKLSLYDMKNILNSQLKD